MGEVPCDVSMVIGVVTRASNVTARVCVRVRAWVRACARRGVRTCVCGGARVGVDMCSCERAAGVRTRAPSADPA
jgi:hypothetical protein